MTDPSISHARTVLQIEAQAIAQLAEKLNHSFSAVVDCIALSQGRIILTGMGKSGLICRKIAATFASTGTPAFFMHPAEAIHGDLGMIVSGDTTIAVSNSGETEEIIRLIAYIKRLGARLIAITGREESTLAKEADLALVYHIDREGCPIGLAPMASTTTTLALGDALAAAVMARKGFSPKDFARFHPGGKLGRTLLRVRELMHKEDEKPLVMADHTLDHALVEMSSKRLGMTAVDLGQEKLGFISDGDIRRLLQQHGPKALLLKAGDVCSASPKTILQDRLAVEALHIMENHHITCLLVVDDQGHYVGALHLHDLWKTQMI